MGEKPVFLSIIIPVYNEEHNILTTFQKVDQYFQKFGQPYEILFVDDGSTDRSRPLLHDLSSDYEHVRLIENPINLGKGFSIRQGMLEGRGDYLIFTDADLATPIEEFDKFIPYLGSDYEVLIGSRRLPDSQISVHQSWYRRWMGEVFYQLVYLILFNDVRDTNCGFKCFRRDVAKEVFQRQKVRRWAFDAETLFLVHRMRYNIKEIPVRWAEPGKSKVVLLKASVVSFFDLFKIRWNDFLGRYFVSGPSGDFLSEPRGRLDYK